MNFDNMKPNSENCKPRGGVKRISRQIGDTPKYNSNFKKKSSLECEYHTFADSVKCEYGETKLLVLNLHTRVTKSDIAMLFGEFGSYKFCKVHYNDKDGWPLGSAEVTFGKKEDAVEAMDLYNGSKLDGQVLNIKLIIPEYPVVSQSGSELSSVNDFEESDSFSEQQILEQELDALFDEFVRNLRARSKSIRLM